MSDASSAEPQARLRLAVVGRVGLTHLGESLRHAAATAGHEVTFFDSAAADAAPRLMRALAWRVDRRPAALDRFCAQVVEACEASPPDVLIATGTGPLSAEALGRLRAAGVVLVNFSTDDPWNRSAKARWHLRALPLYDLVFTPRRANLEDFRRHGCADVRYLPFGYDERHAFPATGDEGDVAAHDVLYVGGADRDRVDFMTRFMREGPPVALVGGYWDRYAATRRRAEGLKQPQQLRALTARAKVNLCLVRRANRDGHVMRSLEIAATGGCMLAEDTAEHRSLFGEDGESVAYFSSPAGAARRAVALIGDPSERRRMADALRARVAAGRHTYHDRLRTMLDAAKGVIR